MSQGITIRAHRWVTRIPRAALTLPPSIMALWNMDHSFRSSSSQWLIETKGSNPGFNHGRVNRGRVINVEERHHHRHHHPGIEQRNRYRDPNVSPSPLRMKIGVFNESIFDLYPAGFHPFCLHYYILITFRSITWVRAYVRKRANSPELFFYRRYSIPAYIYIYIYSRDDNYSYRSPRW